MRLVHGNYRIDLAPDQGGLILRLQWRGSHARWHDLLLPPPRGPIDTASPRRFGLWPLVPFCNRAFGARLLDGDQHHVLPVNDPATSSTIHGFGWQARWAVMERRRGLVRLVHERSLAGDVYAYRAEMALVLGKQGLRVELSVENRAASPLPFGIGFHPWFPAAADTTLRMRNDAELALGPGYRATGTRRFTDGGPYAATPVFRRTTETAHSFIGWHGEALIETPSQGLAIRLAASDTLRCPVVWAPAGAGSLSADFLCVEPQSHGIGAPSEPVARAATPMAQLQPGETLSGWIAISAAPLA
jgi:aldose 1-epimerase